MRILLIGDRLERALHNSLTVHEMILETAASFEDALYLVKEFDFDSVVFDLFESKNSGVQFLNTLKELPSPPPVMIVSEKKSLAEKKIAFDLGVDEYVVKPFDSEELYLRLRVLKRRKQGVMSTALKVSSLVLDLNARIARVSGNTLVLTSKEYMLLELLLLKQNHILSREKINRKLYSDDQEDESNVIAVLMSKIRKKLEIAGLPDLIETVRGEGYIIRSDKID